MLVLRLGAAVAFTVYLEIVVAAEIVLQRADAEKREFGKNELSLSAVRST